MGMASFYRLFAEISLNPADPKSLHRGDASRQQRATSFSMTSTVFPSARSEAHCFAFWPKACRFSGQSMP